MAYASQPPQLPLIDCANFRLIILRLGLAGALAHVCYKDLANTQQMRPIAYVMHRLHYHGKHPYDLCCNTNLSVQA